MQGLEAGADFCVGGAGTSTWIRREKASAPSSTYFTVSSIFFVTTAIPRPHVLCNLNRWWPGAIDTRLSTGPLHDLAVAHYKSLLVAHVFISHGNAASVQCTGTVHFCNAESVKIVFSKFSNVLNFNSILG